VCIVMYCKFMAKTTREKVKRIYKVQLRKFISWRENEKKFMEIFHETEKLGEVEGILKEILWGFFV
jgi:hypothetical protein